MSISSGNATDVGGVRLPNLVYYSLLFDKYLDEAGCAALSISEAFEGFSSLYSNSRERHGLVINHKCSFFTLSSWSRFIDQYVSLDVIRILNINHLYWLPAELLESTIMKLPKLEDLSIKGTQVCTVRQVAKILQACPSIRKLDFTYTEKTEEDIADGLKKENISDDCLVSRFKKLTTLKLSTTVADSKNNIFNDPWLLVIKLLTYWGDCIDLTIEITYTGKRGSRREYRTLEELTAQEDFKHIVVRDWFPLLEWMKSLESLVIIKLGQYATPGAGVYVISRLLDALCDYLFPRLEENPTPRPLHCLWIQDFETYKVGAWKYVIPERLQSFLTGDCDDDDESYEPFYNLEQLGGSTGLDYYKFPLPSLHKLKYVSGHSDGDYNEFHQFCEVHPELEHVSVEFTSWLSDDDPDDAVSKLPKLRSFSCKRGAISKEFVEGMVEGYPVLETLKLTTCRHKTNPVDDRALSTISFPRLTFLSLRGFDLKDGFSLLSIIDGCPKLQSLHLETDSLESSSFPANVKRFFCLALNLRDFRLKWNQHEDDEYPETVLSILKAIPEKSAQLERLVVIDGGSEPLSSWSSPTELANLLVEFTSKLNHLTCCCLTFKQLSADLMKEIKQRVEEEVVTERPSLWFHLDRSLPEASDSGVPWIHYHQIVYPMSFVMPRF